MSQKNVIISLVVGLVFGFLFAATLGVDFFGPDDNTYQPGNNTEGELRKDEEAFRLAYNLTDSIFVPITGDTAYDKIEAGDTFILYSGRETCPFCQRFVPDLQVAAQNKNYTEIFYVDTTDKLNEMFVEDENVNYTPTTFLIKDGVVVETVVGYHSIEEMEQLLEDNLT